MRTLRLAVATVLFLLALSPLACAQATHTFYIFKISATIPVSVTTINFDIDRIATTKLKTNDLINLALGQAPGTRLDSDLFLAMSLTFHPSGDPVLSKMIVCDSSQTGPALVKTVVATLDTLDYDVAFLGGRRKGSGVGTGTFMTTTLGNPSKFAILASSFTGSGLSSGPLSKQQFSPPRVSPVATATIQGRFKFRTTDRNNVTTDINGIVTRAAFKLSGKILGTYVE
ncbi:MAG: hypothetical protein ABMA13_16945 [Chthoniobacteraceae bacterium]